MKIKQEPVMAIGNKGYNHKRQGQNQNRRKQYDNRNAARFKGDQKQCTRCGRVFGEGQLKNEGHLNRVRIVTNPIILQKCANHSKLMKLQLKILVRKRNVIEYKILIPVTNLR